MWFSCGCQKLLVDLPEHPGSRVPRGHSGLFVGSHFLKFQTSFGLSGREAAAEPFALHSVVLLARAHWHFSFCFPFCVWTWTDAIFGESGIQCVNSFKYNSLLERGQSERPLSQSRLKTTNGRHFVPWSDQLIRLAGSWRDPFQFPRLPHSSDTSLV